jgi:16S rRNA (guanine527-N7)-methyltransferase
VGRSMVPLSGCPEWRDQLVRGAASLTVALDSGQVELFHSYARLLQSWGEKINLTARLEPGEILSLHLLDSLALLAVRPPPLGASLLDVGSGAGFPGLPLGIARGDLSVTLLEPSGKRATFLNTTIGRLGLKNVRVVNDRAEFVPDRVDWAGPCDIVVARAVAELPHLLALTSPLVRPGGLFVAWKGPEEVSGHSSGTAGLWLAEDSRIISIPGKESPRALLFFLRTVLSGT